MHNLFYKLHINNRFCIMWLFPQFYGYMQAQLVSAVASCSTTSCILGCYCMSVRVNHVQYWQSDDGGKGFKIMFA